MRADNQRSFAIKFFYGVGDTSNGLKNAAFGSLILFYYSQVLGLPAYLASTAILIALIIDALTDFIIGSLSDSLRHRWGRRHPFLYLSAIPFALTFVALFSPPASLSEMGLFVWLLVLLVLARTVVTFYTVPHMALGAELSTNYHERTVITAFRQFFAYGGAMAFFLGSRALFQPTEQYPDGQMNPDIYPVVGIIAAVAAAAFILISAIGTHSTIPSLPKSQKSPTARWSLVSLVKEIISISGNGPLRYVVFACLFWMVSYGMARALEVYMATYFWHLRTQDVFLLPTIATVGMLSATLIWPFLSGRFGKKQAFIGAGAGFAMITLALPVLKVTGLFPAQGTGAYVPVILGGTFLGAVLAGAMPVLAGSMLADICDDYDLKAGQRQEGVIYGAIHLAIKVGTAGGVACSGIVLTMIELQPQAAPADVSDTTSILLGVGGSALIALLAFVAAGTCLRYPITQTRLREIQQSLRERDAVMERVR